MPSLRSRDEDLIKQKVEIIDFKTISNSINYGSFDIKYKKFNAKKTLEMYF